MSRAINPEAVVAYVHNYRDVVEELLTLVSLQNDESILRDMQEVGREISEFAEELAYATTALQLLRHMAGELAIAAAIWGDRHATYPVSRNHFELPTTVHPSVFGRRFVEGDLAKSEVNQ